MKKIIKVEEIKEPEDFIIYSDTDSVYVKALPIINAMMPGVDVQNEKDMTDAIMIVTSEVQLYVNKVYDTMAKRFFNLDKHSFDAKQEVICKTAFWLAKKRYAEWIIHKEGVLLKEPELDVKGIDIVRSSFPLSFQKFMKEFLKQLLSDVSKDKLDESILEFKKNIKTISVVELAKNTSVKFISQKGDINYNPEERKPFEIVKGTPAQVKAALYYNDLLNKWDLSEKTEYIKHSQKIKWIYLKDNEYNLGCLAMKADETDPRQILDFINTYVDRNAMFEKELKSKLIDFYNVLKWEWPNSSMKTAENFFEF